MAFTTPRTYVAGEVHTAAHHNTYERDNIAWMATDSPACRVYKSTSGSIANVTDTSIAFDQERFDNAAVHSTSVNTTRLTIPTGGGGKYIFGGGVEWIANVTGGRGCHIKLNGTTYIAKFVLNTSAAGGDTSSLTVTSVYAMSAADYVEMFVYQSSGGGLTLNSTGNYSPEFWAIWFRT